MNASLMVSTPWRQVLIAATVRIVLSDTVYCYSCELGFLSGFARVVVPILNMHCLLLHVSRHDTHACDVCVHSNEWQWWRCQHCWNLVPLHGKLVTPVQQIHAG
jgi:hypothetical protein